LLSVAAWSLLSLVFSLARIWAFRPAPEFGYHVFRFNLFGLSSDEAMVRATIGASVAFVWFGIYEYVRSVDVKRVWLTLTVFFVLLIDAAVLVVQRHVDPGFLHPAGWPAFDRLNGVTSFCYALGDVGLALFLLLPSWGATRGPLGALTAANIALLGHAIVASGSRAAFLTALGAAVLWGAVAATRRFEAGRRWAAILTVGALAALIGGTVIAYRVTPADTVTPLGRLKDTIDRQGVFGHLWASRLWSYPLAFRVLGEYPLAGVGAGLYPAEMDKQRALLTPDVATLEPYLLTSNVPNQFLNTGVELGIPAMSALALVFVVAVWAAWPGKGGGGSAAQTVSLLALAGVLQVGPALLNSEAVVFYWLVVGLARRAGGSTPGGEASGTVRARATGAFLAGVLVLGFVGQVRARPGLAVETQWSKLRWGLNIGMQPAEPGGQWTSSDATFVVSSNAPAVMVRWHAGDEAAQDYRAVVSFYVDGILVQRSLAASGRIQESRLPLPAVAGFKRISVRVRPAFVPALMLGGPDQRRLGVFLHGVLPRDAGPTLAAPGP
jgi:hypothetical protein